MSIQDYELFLEPGGKELVNFGESDYIFVRFADRAFDAVINHETVRLENGAEYETSGGKLFDSMVIKNPDPDAPAVIRLAIGTDRFRTRIITGDITTTPGIRTGDGQVIPDTRKTLNLDLQQVPGTGITETQGQFIRYFKENGSPGGDWAYQVDGGARTFENPREFTYTDTNNQGIMVLGQTPQGPNDSWAIEIDPVTGALIADWGVIADLGQPEAVARLGTTLYQRNGFGTKGIYKKAPGGSWELVVSNGANNPSFCVDSLGNLYLASNNSVVKYNADGNVVGSYDYGNYVGSVSIFQNRLYVFASANYRPRILDLNLNSVELLGNTQDGSASVVYGNYLFRLDSGTPAHRIRVEAIETVTDLFAGKATRACENAWLGPRPDSFSAVRTSADISVTNANTATPNVQGELIKLILEWYLGGQVPADYMDLVHGLEIRGSSDQLTGVSYPPITIQSTGQTFLAAKIPDNFAVIFPITVQITIDQRAEQ